MGNEKNVKKKREEKSHEKDKTKKTNEGNESKTETNWESRFFSSSCALKSRQISIFFSNNLLYYTIQNILPYVAQLEAALLEGHHLQ